MSEFYEITQIFAKFSSEFIFYKRFLFEILMKTVLPKDSANALKILPALSQSGKESMKCYQM